MANMKQKAPQTFAFFSEYWGFVDKFWETDLQNEAETDILVQEASNLSKKYGDDPFYKDIIMAFLDKKQREDKEKRTAKKAALAV